MMANKINTETDTIYLSIARIFAIYYVVLIQHNFAPFHPYWNWINASEYPFAFLTPYTRLVTLFTMPLCFFVSGYVMSFTRSLQTDSIKSFLQKKIHRIFIPCLVFGLLFELIQTGTISVAGCMGYKHMWFLFYLFIYFCVSSILLKNTGKWIYWPVMLFLIVSMCIFNKTGKGNLAMYYFYFLLGTLYHQYENYISQYRLYVWVLYLLAIIIVVFNGVDSFMGGVLYALIAIISVLQLLRTMNFKNLKQKRIFRIVNETSYGVYIFHLIYLWIIYQIIIKYDENLVIDNKYLITTPIAIFTIPLSILTTYLIKRYNIMNL